MRLSGPRSRPITFFFWQCRESNPGLRICSQELCPLDHRGGHICYRVCKKKVAKSPNIWTNLETWLLAVRTCSIIRFLTIFVRFQFHRHFTRGSFKTVQFVFIRMFLRQVLQYTIKRNGDNPHVMSWTWKRHGHLKLMEKFYHTIWHYIPEHNYFHSPVILNW
jgi:hypothetical protein